MKFEELKRSLSSKLAQNYILFGNDSYLLDYAYTLILRASGMVEPSMNETKMDANDADAKKINENLMLAPFFSPKRIFKLSGTIKDSIQKEIIPALEVDARETIFVIDAGMDKSGYDKILKYFEVVDCNKLSSDIISRFIIHDLNACGKTISSSALRKVQEYCLYDMSKITIELKKVIALVGSRVEINESDIDEIVTKCEEYSIFEFTEALAKGDAMKAYSVLESFRSKKNNNLMYLIYNHFRRLFYAKISKSSTQTLADMLQVKEFAVKKSLEQAKLFKTSTLKAVLEECARLDEQVKLSMISQDNALDYITLFILNNRG